LVVGPGLKKRMCLIGEAKREELEGQGNGLESKEEEGDKAGIRWVYGGICATHGNGH
jgi:hypothetical protein